MWSYFSRDPTSSFAYEVLDYCPGLEDRALWKLHKGKHKVLGIPYKYKDKVISLGLQLI